MRALHTPGALQQRNLVFLEQKLDPFGQAAGDRPRAFDDLAVVARQALDLDAKVFALLEILIHLGRGQDRLGRDATPVQTHPAGLFLFHDRNRQPELGGPNGGHIAARTGAYHNQIVTFHVVSLSLHHQAHRVFQQAFQLLQKLSASHAVKDAVVARQGHQHG